MKLYRNSKGVWAGTQADARKVCGKDYTTVDVPVDKPSLLRFLNANQVGSGNKEIEPIQPVDSSMLTQSALSWMRWSYDKLNQGQYTEGKELLWKGLTIAKEETVND